MKNFIILSVLSAIVFLSYNSRAGGYAGASYGMTDTNISDHSGITLTGGYAFNDFISIEGRYLFSSGDDSYSGVDISIDYIYGAYLNFTLPVTDSVSVYGIFGHTEGEVTASYMGYSETASDSSSSFGGGVKYDILEAWTVKVEYMSLFDDVDQFQVGLQLNF